MQIHELYCHPLFCGSYTVIRILAATNLPFVHALLYIFIVLIVYLLCKQRVLTHR